MTCFHFAGSHGEAAAKCDVVQSKPDGACGPAPVGRVWKATRMSRHLSSVSAAGPSAASASSAAASMMSAPADTRAACQHPPFTTLGTYKCRERFATLFHRNTLQSLPFISHI